MSEESVIWRRDGRAGRITLNRPTLLNALDLDMIRTLTSVLLRWPWEVCTTWALRRPRQGD